MEVGREKEAPHRVEAYVRFLSRAIPSCRIPPLEQWCPRHNTATILSARMSYCPYADRKQGLLSDVAVWTVMVHQFFAQLFLAFQSASAHSCTIFGSITSPFHTSSFFCGSGSLLAMSDLMSISRDDLGSKDFAI